MTAHPAPSTPPQGEPPRPAGRRPLWIVLGGIFATLAGYGAWTNLRAFTLTASIEIEGTPEQVWTVLADLPAYAQWNPFIVSSSGQVQEGAVLRNVMRDAGGDRTFTPTVLAAEAGRELRWIGRLGPGGIFDGEHRFLIEPITANQVRLIQSEKFTGVLVPFFRGHLLTRTLPQFHAMNDALAQRVASM